MTEGPRRERHDLLFDLSEGAAFLTMESDDVDMIWLDQPAEYAALGLMLRCQRLIRGMHSLVEDQLLDVAAVLVRPTLEASVTGLWFLREGSDAVNQTMGYDRQQIRRAIRSITGTKPNDIGLFDSSIRFWFGEAEDKEFVSMRERAGKLYPLVEGLYFRSHTWVHANVRTSFETSIADEMEKEANSFAGLRPLEKQEALTAAVAYSLLLGRQLHVRLGWNREESFDELLEGLGTGPEILSLLA